MYLVIYMSKPYRIYHWECGLSFTGTIPEAIAQSPYDNFEESYLWFIGEEIR